MPDADPAFRITPLAEADCDELGRLHTGVWREAYAHAMPAEYLAGLRDADSADRWRARLARAEAEGRPIGTVVARDADGRLVGFASAGPCRDDDRPAEWEVYALYVAAGSRATGVADLLVDRVLGVRDASLWVLEDNPRARAFYARHGFAPDGHRAVHDDTGAAEVRLVRAHELTT
jgi:GNAT superfamily N-acetyltransferase